jgi:CO/xanthine dehydrogenase FAD-binding subunit
METEIRRMKQAERRLQGNPLGPEVSASAAEAASVEATVTEDIPIRGSSDYRRQLIKVMVKRTLREAAGRLGGSQVG